MNTQQTTPLTTSNMFAGAVIVNNAHPEWGNFRVLDKYCDGIWNLQERVLNEDEFNYWSIVKNATYAAQEAKGFPVKTF